MPRARTSTVLLVVAIVAVAGAYVLGSGRAATETTTTEDIAALQSALARKAG